MNNRDLSPSLNLPNSSSTIWQDPQAHCIFVSDKVSLHSHKIDNICSSLAGAQLASTFTGSHTKRDTASAQCSCEKILNLCPQYQELQLPDSYQYSDNCSTECILSDLPSGICYDSQNYGNNSVSLSIEKPSIPCITTQYFKETVEELGPEEVWWLYKIESDKKWTLFIGYDSLRIEWKYRDFLHGSKDVDSSGTPSQEEKIVVRGALYEVDVQHRSGSSIYWKGETFLIMRGTWFYEGTWMPLDEILADQIEQEHISHFRGHLLSESVNDEAKRENFFFRRVFIKMRMDCKVYVGNLGNNAAKHELESSFSKFGPLVNVWVARNPPGFAFVEFEDPRDAEDALRALDGNRLCGVRVRVEMSTGRSRRDRYRSPPRRRRSRSRSPRRFRSRTRSPKKSRSKSPKYARRGSPKYEDYRRRSESPENRRRSRSRS